MPSPTATPPLPDPQLELTPTNPEVLTGAVERVIFHNPGNGFCVFTARPRGYRHAITIVGHAAALSAGQWLTASGQWVHDRTYGQQFKAAFLRLAEPATTDGIEKYLASGLIHGIRRVYAKKLVDAFGAGVFDVIESEPHRLREIPGIGRKRADAITRAWAEQKVIREIMAFLLAHGIGTARTFRIYRTYGVDALQVMSENPYRLAQDVRGVGFKTADAIARRLGIGKTAAVRVRAGVTCTLSEAAGNGHCGLPADQLIPFAARLLEVPDDLVRRALDRELADGNVIETTVGGTPCVFLPGLYRAEQTIAERLRTIAQGPPPWNAGDTAATIRDVERRIGLQLAPQQRQALDTALSSKTLVITGGPGVGKTTLVNAFLAALENQDLVISLCAPTGRAAKRLGETTGREAMTIHRLLETNPRKGGFRRNRKHPLACDGLIVDETSMVDVNLMRSLLQAVPDDAGLLLLGDADQLPSVGPGQVLTDIIDAQAVPVARLTDVYRQAARSRIITMAHEFNQGNVPDLSSPAAESDFYFLPVDSPEAATKRILSLVKTHIPDRFGLDPTTDIQVLCPMNRGAAGTHALNARLQPALNPATAPRLEHGGGVFVPGDKVMQTENNYEADVYNGDIGRVEDVDPVERKVWVSFDGHLVTYEPRNLDTLTLAYATTIHKSQGSEYPAVVIPWLKQHYPMLRRSLLYTAVTRGKRLVILVGEKQALHIAVRNAAARRRWSRLSEWLRKA